mgnify:CR=1 FL=1
MSEQDDKVKDLIKKAESLSNIGMHKEAIKVLLEANELKPKDYDILRLLGEEYCLYVDTEKGLDYFVEAMELKSNSLSPWIEYAYEYCSICKFDKAEKLILKAIELYPNSFNTYNLYNVLGCLYFNFILVSFLFALAFLFPFFVFFFFLIAKLVSVLLFFFLLFPIFNTFLSQGFSFKIIWQYYNTIPKKRKAF